MKQLHKEKLMRGHEAPENTDARAALILVSFIFPTTGLNEDALYH